MFELISRINMYCILYYYRTLENLNIPRDYEGFVACVSVSVIDRERLELVEIIFV